MTSVHNADIAALFDAMADLLEIGGANPFRVRAYRNASRIIGGLGREIRTMVEKGEDLTVLPGIGEDLGHKIREIVQTGHLRDLETLEETLPPSLLEIRRIRGLGPKKVQTLYRSLGVRSVPDLLGAIRSGRLRTLEGFGEKTEHRILESLQLRPDSAHRFRIDIATQYAQPLVKALGSVPGVSRATVAGSFRRRKETVGDLDILVTAGPQAPVMDTLTSYEEILEVVSRGRTRSTVILNAGIQVDLRVVPDSSYGSALHYFTGSKSHNISLRRAALSRGLKINEYGVFRGKKSIAGDTEESVYGTLGLSYVPPELRENQGEIEAASRGQLPVLIEQGDLKGDLHTHTSTTDGNNTLSEMAEAARKRSYEYLAITEHSRRLGMAHGLDERGLMDHIDRIDRLGRDLNGITLLRGIEVDILPDGTLDLPDRILSRLDLVIGAVHSQFHLSRDKQTERFMRALDHPLVCILAHPGGRLIGERPPMDLDWPRLIRHARHRGTVLEINSQPSRLDLTDTYARMARDEGVLLAVNSDAHGIDQLDNLVYGIGQARRGWVTKKDVINTRSLGELRAALGKIRLK